MNTLEALNFPDTAWTTDRQFPLFLLFSPVHIIVPVEFTEKTRERSSDIFMNSRFCQEHTPHPLGKDRERFLYLINDIQNRKDDYAAQLSHITLASMASSPGRGEQARHEIISSLLGKTNGAAAARKEETEETLWQARLVLKIAELLDREEEEVAQTLVALEENVAEVFGRLKGEDDEEEDTFYTGLMKIKTKISKPRTAAIAKRFRAWLKIAENSTIFSSSIWLTTRQEAADILFENYQKETNRQPVPVALVELPARTGKESQMLLDTVSSFHATTAECLTGMSNALLSADADKGVNESFFDFHALWIKELENTFPAERYGRKSARFYLFNGHVSRYCTPEVHPVEAGTSLLCVFADE